MLLFYSTRVLTGVCIGGGVVSFIFLQTEVPHAGELDVFVKVSRETFSPYPKFKLHVNSPVESIFRCVSTSSQQGGSNTPLACIAAYLLHTHEKDQSTLSYTDTIVCRILQSQPTEWNLSSLIFGNTQFLLNSLVILNSLNTAYT